MMPTSELAEAALAVARQMPHQTDTRHASRRGYADRVLMRADWLDPAERALVVQVLANGVSPADVAAVAGVTRRSVQRRVRAVSQRLISPLATAVLQGQGRWDRTTASAALNVWVRGCTMRETGRRLSLSLHEVRQHLQMARGLIEADVKAALARRAAAAKAAQTRQARSRRREPQCQPA